jgi:acyl-CoA thioesterase-1
MRHILAVSLLFCLLQINCSKGDVNRAKSVEPTRESTMAKINYIALGDSTGVGVGARNGGYVSRLFENLKAGRPASSLINLCVSGATSNDLIRDQLDRGIREDPQLVTVGIGINDIGHGVQLEQFASNLDLILRRLRKETQAVVVVTNIPDVSSSPRVPPGMRQQSQARIEQFNVRLAQIATVNGATVFDVYTLTHEELPKHPEYFSADGFHPSDAGYELWAQQMWPVVKKAVEGK